MLNRFIIIGKEGYVAQRLVSYLKTLDRDFIQTSFEPADDDLYLQLGNVKSFDFQNVTENDFIVYLAAISSPDVCKNQYDFAYNINVTGTTEFIKGCVEKNAKVLFISSDVVFGNVDGPINEESSFAPLGNYANMKMEVEQNFSKEDSVKIFRFSYVFSKDDKYSCYVQNCIKDGSNIEVFHPFSRRLIFIDDILEGIVKLADNWSNIPYKAINMAGPELLSRFDIAELYIKILNGKSKIRIIKNDEDFFKERKRIIDMGSIYVEKLLGRSPTKIKDAIEQEMNLNYKDFK